MPNIHQTVKELADLEAGGPGSGRKREMAYNRYKMAKEKHAQVMNDPKSSPSKKDASRRRLDNANVKYQGFRD